MDDYNYYRFNKGNNNFFEELGYKKALKIFLIVFCISCLIYLLNNLYIHEEIRGDIVSGEVVEVDQMYEVTGMRSMSEGISGRDMVAEVMGGISDEAALATTFIDIKEMCTEVKPKDGKIIIPVGATGTEFGDIAIYGWSQCKQSVLSWILNTESKKEDNYLFFRMYGNYILISWHSNLMKLQFFSIKIEYGEIQNWEENGYMDADF